MTDRLAILIVGGYGTFGGRIVELLESDDRLTLIVAGRSVTKARDYCQARGHTPARLLPAAFDRMGDVSAQLAVHRPDVLIDASGPFQAYGAAPYAVVEACIAARVHYIDLADGSDFVAGIDRFDAAATAAGIFVLSGASSFPVLTAAVVRRLSDGMAGIEHIRGGIAPSPYAGVGLNVIRAIAGYAGQSVPLRDNGSDRQGHPFAEQMRFTIAPPGRVPLRNALFSLVDVPDLRTLRTLWPDAKTIWMGAAPVPEVLHRALIGLAWLVRLKILPSLSPFAGIIHLAANLLRWGEHRGGMFVDVTGTDTAGRPLRRTWHLLAEGDHGPLIPSMAVQALIRRILAGHPPPPGARSAARDLELADYEALFAQRTIYPGIRTHAASEPLYAKILDTAWDTLPAEIRAMHATRQAGGRARVERGTSILARLTAAAFGFPAASEDTPVAVQFDPVAGTEVWTRTFAGKRFASRQYAGTGRWDGLLCERFGPLTFAMAVVVENGRLSLVVRGWNAFGLPLPRWLSPWSEAHETVEDGKFHFHVAIGHWATGLIVRYRGWLNQPAEIVQQGRVTDTPI
jgi:hypothetical protein